MVGNGGGLVVIGLFLLWVGFLGGIVVEAWRSAFVVEAWRLWSRGCGWVT